MTVPSTGKRREIKLKRCGCCFSCDYYAVPNTNLEVSFSENFAGNIDVHDNATLWAVLSTRATADSFPLLSSGGVADIAESPCEDWRSYLQKLYEMGFRHVHFEYED